MCKGHSRSNVSYSWHSRKILARGTEISRSTHLIKKKMVCSYSLDYFFINFFDFFAYEKVSVQPLDHGRIDLNQGETDITNTKLQFFASNNLQWWEDIDLNREKLSATRSKYNFLFWCLKCYKTLRHITYLSYQVVVNCWIPFQCHWLLVDSIGHTNIGSSDHSL